MRISRLPSSPFRCLDIFLVRLLVARSFVHSFVFPTLSEAYTTLQRYTLRWYDRTTNFRSANDEYEVKKQRCCRCSFALGKIKNHLLSSLLLAQVSKRQNTANQIDNNANIPTNREQVHAISSFYVYVEMKKARAKKASSSPSDLVYCYTQDLQFPHTGKISPLLLTSDDRRAFL